MCQIDHWYFIMILKTFQPHAEDLKFSYYSYKTNLWKCHARIKTFTSVSTLSRLAEPHLLPPFTNNTLVSFRESIHGKTLCKLIRTVIHNLSNYMFVLRECTIESLLLPSVRNRTNSLTTSVCSRLCDLCCFLPCTHEIG